MRIEIWFDNSNPNAMMRCFPEIDEKSVDMDEDTGRLYFKSATSDHVFMVNMDHVAFIEYMPSAK